MRVFQGFRGFYHAKKNNAPMSLFWEWLRAKWIADMVDAFWFFASLPLSVPAVLFVIIEAIGLRVARIGEKGCDFFLSLKPDWMGSKHNYRSAQQDAARRYRDFIAGRKTQ